MARTDPRIDRAADEYGFASFDQCDEMFMQRVPKEPKPPEAKPHLDQASNSLATAGELI